MTELGFALIGCGGMGKTEARVLRDVPRARLVAVCDVFEAAASHFGAEMGVPAYTSVSEVLSLPDVGAVIVATPNGLHTQIVLDAAGAGKHIFCEKPMAFTVAECDQMIAAAEQHGVRLMVGHVLRLLPLFQRVVDIFDSGALGQPVAAQITRIGWIGDPAARYRLRKETTGGQLYDITVHEIDLLHRICGATKTVCAHAERYVQQHIDYDDTDLLQLTFQNGATAQIFSSLASPLSTSNGVIIGTGGALRYDHGAGTITYRRTDAAAPAGNASEAGAASTTEATVTETVTRAAGENGYLRELRSLTEWVLDGREPLLTAQEGRAAIQVVEAAYQSASTGEPVSIGR